MRRMIEETLRRSVDRMLHPSFVETMRGTLRDRDGGLHPVSFEVEARAEGMGRFALAGVVCAPGWAEEASAEGSLEIGPLFRFIRYRVRFPAEGGTWELRGEKSPTPLAPLRSMSTLPVTLADAAGTEVADGTMHFAWTDLPAFAATWLPLWMGPARRLDARREALKQTQ